MCPDALAHAALATLGLRLPGPPLSPRPQPLQQVHTGSPPALTPAVAAATAQQLLLASLRPPSGSALEVDQRQEDAATPVYRTYRLFEGSGGFGRGGCWSFKLPPPMGSCQQLRLIPGSCKEVV